jgi:copper chaperone CopZ
VEITHTEINAEINKTLAKLSISGMTCSAGCGGKIQQDLSAMAGVTSTSLDYEDNRDANVVIVEYNPTEVNELEFIKKVNAIANGKYQVKAVEVVTYKGLQTARTSGGSTTGAALQENFSKMVHVFDLVQSISKLITPYSR